jgi:hypothetical protein
LSPFPVLLGTYGTFLAAAAGVAAGALSLLLLGLPLVRAFRPAEEGGATDVLHAFAAGVTLYGTALVLLGFAGAYTPLACALLLLPGPALSLRRREALRAEWRAFLAARRAVAPGGGAAAAAAAAAVAVLLPAVVAPEIFYDALYYHLGLPSQYLLSGRVAAPPDVVHGAFPATLDLVFGAAFALGGTAAAKSLGLLFLLLAAAAAGELSLLLGGGRRPAAALLLTVPGFAVMATLTSVDVGMAFAAAAALCAVVESRRGGAPGGARLLLLAAFPLGLAAGSKYTGLALPALLLPAAVLFPSPAPLRERGRAAAAALGLALLLASPWYVRNLAAHANPFHPAFPALFGGDGAGAYALGRIERDLPHRGLPEAAALLSALLSGGRALGAGSDLGILLPPAFVALAVLAFRREGWRLPAAVALAGLLLGAAGPQATRYLFPLFPAAAAAGGTALALLAGKGRPWRIAAAALLLLGSAWNLSRLAAVERGLFSPRGELSSLLSGRIDRERYLESLLPHAAAARWARELLPKDAVILFVGETRPLYFERRVVFASAYDRPRLARWVEESADGDALLARLRREGITHLLVNRGELSRLNRGYGYLELSAEGKEKVREMMGRVKPLRSEGGIVLAALPPG